MSSGNSSGVKRRNTCSKRAVTPPPSWPKRAFGTSSSSRTVVEAVDDDNEDGIWFTDVQVEIKPEPLDSDMDETITADVNDAEIADCDSVLVRRRLIPRSKGRFVSAKSKRKKRRSKAAPASKKSNGNFTHVNGDREETKSDSSDSETGAFERIRKLLPNGEEVVPLVPQIQLKRCINLETGEEFVIKEEPNESGQEDVTSQEIGDVESELIDEVRGCRKSATKAKNTLFKFKELLMTDEESINNSDEEFHAYTRRTRMKHAAMLADEDEDYEADGNEDDDSNDPFYVRRVLPSHRRGHRKIADMYGVRTSRVSFLLGPSDETLKSYLKEELPEDAEKPWNYHEFRRLCKLCQIEFDCKYAFLSHNPCYTTKRRMREMFDNAPTKDYDCEVCLAQFDTSDEYEKHTKSHYDPLYSCKMCNLTSNYEDEMSKHAMTHDQPSLKVRCVYPECNRLFNDANQARDHVERHFVDCKGHNIPKLGNRWVGPIPLLGKEDPRILKSGRLQDTKLFIAFKGDRESYSDMYTYKPNNNVCDECQKDFKNDYVSARVHLPCYQIKADRRKQQGKKSAKKYDCEFCERSMDILLAYKSHVICHKEREWCCNECDHKSTTEQAALVHTQKHTNESIVVCLYPNCRAGGYFRRRKVSKVSDHIREEHLEITPTTCRDLLCGLQFKTVDGRERHEKLNHKNLLIRMEREKRVKEENPTLPTRRRVRIYKPSKKRKKEKPPVVKEKCAVEVPPFEGTPEEREPQIMKWLDNYLINVESYRKKDDPGFSRIKYEETCDLCNMTFESRPTFAVHAPCYYVRRSRQLMEAGIDEAARYECDYCHLTYECIDRLQKHVGIHLEPQFKCNWPNCEFLFKTFESARAHNETHLDVKRVKCNIEPEKCQILFRSRAHCKHHIMRTHLRLEEFQCGLCPQKLPFAREYRLHMRRMHNGPGEGMVGFYCPVEGCDKKFLRRKIRIDHLIKHHRSFDVDEFRKTDKKQSRAKRMNRSVVVNEELPDVSPKDCIPVVLRKNKRKDEIPLSEILAEPSEPNLMEALKSIEGYQFEQNQ